MKTKSVVLFALTLLLARLCCGQSTVNFTAGIGQRDVMAPGGLPISDGNWVGIGAFAAGFDVTQNAANPAALFAQWQQYGSTTIATIFGQPGHFADNASSLDPVFDSRKIWLFISLTSDNAAPAPDLSNLTAYGLYSSTTAAWSFPVQGALYPGNVTSISSSDVTEAPFGSYDANHLALALTTVPEPSTWTLIGLGMLGFVLSAQQGKRQQRLSR